MSKNARIVFHLPGRFTQSFGNAPHLKVFARVKRLFVEHGATVEVRRRAEALRDTSRGDWSDLLEPVNLHVIENGGVQQENALNTTLAYLQNFFHLDPRGVLANSSAFQASYSPGSMDPKHVSEFWAQLQTRFVERRQSRYSQPAEHTRLPSNAIAVFLQGEFPQKWRTAHCSSEDMLRAVAQYADGRPIVVKPHPVSGQNEDRDMINRLIDAGLPLHPVTANVHDVLAQCDLTVSFNSAVSIEGFMHKKPTVLFGKSDFHHVAETVTSPDQFPDAIKRAWSKTHNYADYLTWYFTNFCLAADDPRLDQKLLNIIEKIGFTQRDFRFVPSAPPETANLRERQVFAAKVLTRILRAKDEVSRVKVIKCLKASEKNWVFVARVNGEKVVLKRFMLGNPSHTVRSLKGELDFVEAHATDERFQANRCLFAWPDDGIAVLSFAPGPRLGDKIAKSKGKARARLLKLSGEWLKHYCAPRRRHRTFGPGFWVKQLAGKSLSHITSKIDRRMLETLLENLREQSRRTHGSPVVQAATHGDYVGMNAHFHRGTIYGVDIQGECWRAIAKEVALFIVWQQIHDPSRPFDRQFGIAQSDLDAFLDSGVLPVEEYKTTLPFFIGFELYRQFVAEYQRAHIRSNTQSAIWSYLDR